MSFDRLIKKMMEEVMYDEHIRRRGLSIVTFTADILCT